MTHPMLALRLALLSILLLTLSCAPTTHLTRMSTVEPIVVSWHVYGPGGEDQAPELLKSRVLTDLRERGFAPIEQGAADFSLVVDLRTAEPVRVEKNYRWTVALRATFAQNNGTPRYIEHTYSTTVTRQTNSPRLAIEGAQSRIAADIDSGAERFIATLDPRLRIKKRPPSAGLYRAGDALYFIMVDRFANGDPSNDDAVDPADPQAFHGGDLQGIIDNLDHLKALGIKTLWLSPIFKMRTEPFYGHGAFHGYWLEDPNLIEPRFGDEATLRKLQDELKARDMRLVLDVVLNHVGPDSVLVARHPEWFHLKGGITDWNDEVQVQTHDVHGLPDIDQSVPEAYDWVAGGTLSWIERIKPAGYRLDAVKHISNTFWQKFNNDARTRAGEDFLLLGELLDGNPANLVRAAEQGGFNAMFDFPLHFALVDVFCKDQSPARLGAILSADRLYGDMLGPQRQGLFTLLDNHDLPRILSACNNDLVRVRQALTFMLTARGTPSFTWGTEAGLEGATEPQNRADMVFGLDHPLERVIREGLEKRRLQPVLQSGMDVILRADDSVFAYLRLGDERQADAVLVVVNTSAELQTVVLPPELQADQPQFEIPAQQTEVAVLSVPAEKLQAFRAQHERPQPVNVELVVNDLKLAPGESLVLVGSGPELANWSPGPDAPKFLPKNSQLVLNAALPSGLVFAYKLVRLKDGKAVWEERADRFLFVKPGQSISLSFGR